jgi:hypothetical protein
VLLGGDAVEKRGGDALRACDASEPEALG